MVVLLLGLFRIELFLLTVKKYVLQKRTGLVLDCMRQYHHMGTVRLQNLSSRCRRTRVLVLLPRCALCVFSNWVFIEFVYLFLA